MKPIALTQLQQGRVLVVGDLIATGGSMMAACKLLQRLQDHAAESQVLQIHSQDECLQSYPYLSLSQDT
jgi:adenine/guanine phosphoribosyltransferase-like PRPP-binding protein